MTLLREVTRAGVEAAAEAIREAGDMPPEHLAYVVLKAAAGVLQKEGMTPGEVAEFWRVDPKTVTRWVRENRIDVWYFTLGGERRFSYDAMLALRDKHTVTAPPEAVLAEAPS